MLPPLDTKLTHALVNSVPNMTPRRELDIQKTVNQSKQESIFDLQNVKLQNKGVKDYQTAAAVSKTVKASPQRSIQQMPSNLHYNKDYGSLSTLDGAALGVGGAHRRNYSQTIASLRHQADQSLASIASTKRIIERKMNYKENHRQLQEAERRHWMCKTGRDEHLDFLDDELRKLKECFNQLDENGSGSVGIEELEDPLIGLGFADNRQEVLDMIEEVDEDKSGQIEFDEFLMIIKNSDAGSKSSKINKFFKDMSSGRLGGKDLNFSVFVNNIKRKYMLDNFLSKKKEERRYGARIFRNMSELH